MTLIRKTIAIATLLAAAGFTPAAIADSSAPIGTIARLMGNLYAGSEKGIPRILAEHSPVRAGETLTTGATAYVRIGFADGSEVSLGPETTIRIDRFSFDKANPDDSIVVISLISGELRTASLELGRHDPNRVQIVTPVGTLHAGGATVFIRYGVATGNTAAMNSDPSFAMLAQADLAAFEFPGNAVASDASNALFSPASVAPVQLAQNAPKPGTASGLAPGLYVQVIDGMINLSNKGGSQSFAAGQFGYTASFVQPPVVLPKNPGMQFTPPPVFSSSSSGQASNSPSKANSVDCEVR